MLDPRSYLAKSVPQRMAIISAGVIMNVIFAFIFAVAAYMMGVPETWPAACRPCAGRSRLASRLAARRSHSEDQPECGRRRGSTI